MIVAHWLFTLIPTQIVITNGILKWTKCPSLSGSCIPFLIHFSLIEMHWDRNWELNRESESGNVSNWLSSLFIFSFRSIARIYVYLPSYFLTIRHCITMWNRSSFTSWQKLIHKVVTWLDTFQRLVFYFNNCTQLSVFQLAFTVSVTQCIWCCR